MQVYLDTRTTHGAGDITRLANSHLVPTEQNGRAYRFPLFQLRRPMPHITFVRNTRFCAPELSHDGHLVRIELSGYTPLRTRVDPAPVDTTRTPVDTTRALLTQLGPCCHNWLPLPFRN